MRIKMKTTSIIIILLIAIIVFLITQTPGITVQIKEIWPNVDSGWAGVLISLFIALLSILVNLFVENRKEIIRKNENEPKLMIEKIEKRTYNQENYFSLLIWIRNIGNNVALINEICIKNLNGNNKTKKMNNDIAEVYMEKGQMNGFLIPIKEGVNSIDVKMKCRTFDGSKFNKQFNCNNKDGYWKYDFL